MPGVHGGCAVKMSSGDVFERRVQATGLLPSRAGVLVALSGGLDSVVLLHLLRFGGRKGSLWAAHFDHAMRPDSAADRAWVTGLCRAWEVPLLAERATPAPRSESAARASRYAFLARAADEVGAERIATAHHADDQAETLLFRLARGTNLRGLAGIPARRGRIVRPLLPFRRAELAAYAAAARLRWREDPTNRDTRLARNRIRHALLPVLESEAPGIVDTLLDIAAAAAAADAAWSTLAAACLERAVLARDADSTTLAANVLRGYHPTVRARVIRAVLERLGSAPGRTGTLDAIEFISSGASGAFIELPGAIRLERSFDRFSVRRGPAPRADADRTLIIGQPGGGRGVARLGGRSFTVEWTLSPRDDDGHTAVFDPTALRFPLELRGWRPGDRIRLAYGRKKLKKLFAERRVPRAERASVPILVDADGQVLMAAGLARAARAIDAAPRARDERFAVRVELVQSGEDRGGARNDAAPAGEDRPAIRVDTTGGE